MVWVIISEKNFNILKIKEELALKAKKHTNRLIWFGLVAMSVQAGILARLTWFDYSWDIVEPISYFVTYAAVIGVYAYFVLTRKVKNKLFVTFIFIGFKIVELKFFSGIWLRIGEWSNIFAPFSQECRSK